jgi:hypothetical protein
MAEAPIVAKWSGEGASPESVFDPRIFLPSKGVEQPISRMGRRLLSLLLFVAGYLLLATLAPLVAAAPTLTAFTAATLLLARERAPARI